MNMKKLFLTIVGLFLGFTLYAQTPFIVDAPKYNTFVKIKEGVNLRKSPDAKSPRLLLVGVEDCYDCAAVPEFSARAPRSEFEQVAHTDLAPVLSESGDWYQILYSIDVLEAQYSKRAYVMKKFCTQVARRPLSLPAPKMEWGGYHVAKIAEGPYKDCCIQLFYGLYDAPYIKLGKYVDGMFVFTKSISCEQYEGASLKIEGNEGEYMLKIPAALFPGDTSGVEKLARNPQIVNYLFSNVDKFTNTSDVYFGLVGDNEWHWMYME